MALRRDPFARGELERTCEANTKPPRKVCVWCGQTPARLYRYEWISDGGRRGGKSRLFCNIDCWEAY